MDWTGKEEFAMSNKGNISETTNDPHPAHEDGTDSHPHPGGTRTPKDDIYPNDAIHDGEPKKRPDNAQVEGPSI
jgi:hypothetical protein